MTLAHSQLCWQQTSTKHCRNLCFKTRFKEGRREGGKKFPLCIKNCTIFSLQWQKNKIYLQRVLWNSCLISWSSYVVCKTWGYSSLSDKHRITWSTWGKGRGKSVWSLYWLCKWMYLVITQQHHLQSKQLFPFKWSSFLLELSEHHCQNPLNQRCLLQK